MMGFAIDSYHDSKEEAENRMFEMIRNKKFSVDRLFVFYHEDIGKWVVEID